MPGSIPLPAKSRTINLIGKRFTRLTVLEKDSKKGKDNQTYWKCLCDCGNYKLSTHGNLTSKHIQSCGCLQRENSELARKYNKKAPGTSGKNKLYNIYKWNANKRKLSFSLSKDDFFIITKQNCFYCGQEPKSKSINGTNKDLYIYNGIDRLDNNEGYNINNLVACCSKCNFAKRQMSLDEFKNWIKLVYESFYVKK